LFDVRLIAYLATTTIYKRMSGHRYPQTLPRQQQQRAAPNYHAMPNVMILRANATAAISQNQNCAVYVKTKGMALNYGNLGMPKSVVSIMPAPFINDPNYWRLRAEQMRALANDAKDEEAKQAMLRIARDYDLLAVRAEQRSKGSPQSI